MRAAILTAYNEPLVIEDVSAPAIGPHDALVHIDASGVCHSDLSFANGSVPLPPPVILGHEGAGTVLAVGSDVSRVQRRRPGDLVVHARLWQLLLLPARPVAALRDDGRAHVRAEGDAGRRQRGHRRERARHLRRRDDRRRVDAGEGGDRPPVGAARADRMRHHHRRRRRAQHRAGAAGRDGHRHRLRWRRPVRASRARASRARRASSPSTRWR